jgi:hypothetical protein
VKPVVCIGGHTLSAISPRKKRKGKQRRGRSCTHDDHLIESAAIMSAACIVAVAKRLPSPIKTNQYRVVASIVTNYCETLAQIESVRSARSKTPAQDRQESC